jgi:hypothetical protein
MYKLHHIENHPKRLTPRPVDWKKVHDEKY